MHLSDCSCPHHHLRSRHQAPITPEGKSPVRDAFQPSPSAERGFDLDNLDRSANPRQDFYQFAVGGWRNSHTIPDNKSSIGSFDQLAERNREALHGILEGLRDSKAPDGSDERKLSDFYASGMDTATIEAAGAKPLQPLFERIQGISNSADLFREVGHLQGVGVDALFSFYCTQDSKNSTQNIAEVAQSGLGLPDREYYFNQDEKSQEIRKSYQEHIQRTFQLLGDSPQQAADGAARVIALETRLAETSLKKEELRDPNAVYNMTTREGLQQMAPRVDWDSYLKERGQADLGSLNVATPKFFQGLDKMMGDTPIEDWKTYLRWQTISATSWALSSDFQDENFNFSKVLSGVKEKSERWKKIVVATDNALGEALGRKYLDTNFSPESKARVKDMLKNIRASLKDDLQQLSWMSPETRAQAVAKLEAITEKIGYPDKWADNSSIPVNRGVFVNNVLSTNQWGIEQSLKKIGTQVDPDEWGMTPPTVNAYYNPLANEIVFPAGILQPPFFNPKADDAVNYGGVGVVIGHEITHGFDDSGAQFDAQGNLRNWWSDEDKEHFVERSQGIIKQANQFQVKEGLFLNGPVVVGESMADLGGVELAYQALQRSRAGKPPEVIDGFTSDQRFFLGFAQVWADKTRPEAEEMLVRTDEHPVSEFRVNGTLQNVPEFAQAFGAQPGDPMVRPKELQTVLWESPRFQAQQD